jgi:hypothetical protein
MVRQFAAWLHRHAAIRIVNALASFRPQYAR